MIEIEIKAFFGETENKGDDAKKIGSREGDTLGIDKNELIKRLRALGFAFDYACEEADCYYQAPDRDFRKTDEALRIRTCVEVPGEGSANTGVAVDRGFEECNVDGSGGADVSGSSAGTCAGIGPGIGTSTCGGSVESRALVTYKGPKQDSESHTRREIEVEIPDAEAATELFKSLGYKPVLMVSKHREVYTLTDEISVCLDDVAGLGFAVEIEKLIDDSRFGNSDGKGNRAQDETLAPKSDLEKEKAAAREELLSLLDKLGIPRSALTMKTYLEMLLEKSKR